MIQEITSIPGPGRKTVLLFWAPWHADSAPGGVCDAVLQALAASSSESLVIGRVQAEDAAAVTQHYQIQAVPTFLLINAAGTVVERLEGSQDLSRVTRAVQALVATKETDAAPNNSSLGPSSAAAAQQEDDTETKKQQLQQRLKTLINAHSVMLFIKGTPTAPRCGFSKQAVQLLQDHGIAFASFDILQDETVRQGLKEYSDWPTYPQLYVNGELMGGLDILKEMAEDTATPLKDQLGLTINSTSGSTITAATSTPVVSLKDRLDKLVRQERVMLFMKGLPSAPQCGFSRQMVQLLQDHGIEDFGAFDILQDPEVRQGLKEYSDWPTYPQLYVNGELIGGLDIVQEMADDGTLEEAMSG